ncbi:MAG TPA: CBS domain-containing protein [Candidatus Sulfomarinibacteraceae bacterium]|nr:CBS domain-containing protein [Candidatus Sulfomarinibacteraceae bacterium]
MLLILTHENADFDAVASQVAAHKLYPEGVPLLSRRVNRNVKQFLALYWDTLPFMRMEEWRRRQIDQVVLVDTQSVPGVRGLREETPVRVIDHHTPDGIPAEWEQHIEELGATTTLLVEMLQSGGKNVRPVEATLLLLGIHEDTGSLTYGTTTARDAHAAAWLLEQGADLSVVRRFLEIPLSDQQQALYEQLQENTEWLQVEGQAIALATAVAAPDFDDEISAIAHRMRDGVNPAGLLLLVQLRQHVQLVARSTTDNVNVAIIARALGGGGHGRAAAATIMDLTLEEAAARVKELLPRAVQPAAKVAQMMSRGVQTLPADATVQEAARQMQRFGHEGYPIVDPDTQRLVGLLTRRAVDRAIRHDLARLHVSQIMKSGRVMVRPSDSIERVQQLMIEEDWGQIPVSATSDDEEGPDQLIGIVTRTDLLRLLTKAVLEESQSNLCSLLSQSLPPVVWRMVQMVSEVADEAGMPIYFVGGLVRDLLLELPSADVDMVVEGDAIALAHRLSERFGGRVRSHERFGTAKWLLDEAAWRAVAPEQPLHDAPETIDFVTARTEFYDRPSALPEVESGSIKLDLHRRDFTINTLAIRLDGAHLGELLDFYGGLRDLEQGVIRVLHSLSFIDDATRILRAVRLEQRLDFKIEARTAELISDALPMLERVSGERIRHEIELILREPDPVPIMARLDDIGVMEALHPALEWTEEMAQTFYRLQGILQEPPWHEALQEESPASVYFALWMGPLAAGVRRSMMKLLKVRKSTREEVEGVVSVVQALQSLPPDAAPSRVEKQLRPYEPHPRILLAARAALDDGPARRLLEQYQREWRRVRTALDGNDLREIGLKPGPQYGELLDRLLAARLDGKVQNETQERELLEDLLESGEFKMVDGLEGR